MSTLNHQPRAAVWSERLDRFAGGSVTVAEFRRRGAVSEASFYAWRKRLAGTLAETPRSRVTAAKFLPVVVSPATVQPLLKLPGGAAIELPSRLGQRQLVDLITAVVEATRRTAEDA